jgi:hypothetical protein
VRLTTSHRKTLLLCNLNRRGQGPIWAVAPLDRWKCLIKITNRYKFHYDIFKRINPRSIYDFITYVTYCLLLSTAINRHLISAFPAKLCCKIMSLALGKGQKQNMFERESFKSPGIARIVNSTKLQDLSLAGITQKVLWIFVVKTVLMFPLATKYWEEYTVQY